MIYKESIIKDNDVLIGEVEDELLAFTEDQIETLKDVLNEDYTKMEEPLK